MNKLADFYQFGVNLALDELGLLKESAGPGMAASMGGATGTGAAPAPAAPAMGGGQFGGSARVSLPQLQSQFNSAGMSRGIATPPMKSPLRG
jgi:hypothetical protein